MLMIQRGAHVFTNKSTQTFTVKGAIASQHPCWIILDDYILQGIVSGLLSLPVRVAMLYAM